MSTISAPTADEQSNSPTFELVSVRDHENREHSFNVENNVEFIGGGVRGTVYKIFVKERGTMAMKQYPAARLCDISGEAEVAMSAHKTLREILPPNEHTQLVQPLYVDKEKQRLFLPLLNTDQWVVGTANNSSEDRRALRANKLPDLRQFDESIARLLDALEHVGKAGSLMCADVYFFTVNHASREFGYVYGDYEAMYDKREPINALSIAPLNILGATVSLHSFLRECVQSPDTYLKSLRVEVHRRLQAYENVDMYLSEVVNSVESMRWPEPTLKEHLKAALASAPSWLEERWRTIGTD